MSGDITMSDNNKQIPSGSSWLMYYHNEYVHHNYGVHIFKVSGQI